MKKMKIVLLFILLNVTVILLINAQTFNNGLYVNEERREFVIIKNDTVQFRYYNDDALSMFTLGEGVLKIKRKRKFKIQPSSSFIEKTSEMYRRQRSDDKLSIRILAHDSLPIFGMNMKISCLKDKKYYILAYTDMFGELLLEKNQFEYFDKKPVLINATLVGYTEIEKKILLEKGYDYIIKTRIPDVFSGVVARGNKKIEIRKLNEDEISIGGNTEVKLKKIVDDYPYSDFPFAQHVQSFK